MINDKPVVSPPEIKEWTIDAPAGTASWDHVNGEGGLWNVSFGFKPPSTLTAGQSNALNLSVNVTSCESGSGCTFGIGVAGGDLVPGGDRLDVHADNHKSNSGSKAVALSVPASASTLSLVLDVGGGPRITYTYERATVDCPRSHRVAHPAASNEVRVTACEAGCSYHKAGTPPGSWLPVTLDIVLRSSDEVGCDPDGSVTLAFADNSTVVVRNTTQLKIASFFTEGGVVRTEILLKMGEVAAQVNKSEATKSDFRIKTPTATTSRRGTIFSVFYDPIAKATIVTTTEGVAILDPTGPGLKTVEVPAGREVEATPTAVSPLAAIGKAGARGGVNRLTARDRVLAVVARGNGPCGSTTPRTNAFAVKPIKAGWQVTVKLTGKHKGSSKWRVVRGKVKPANALARAVGRRCG